jgi:hypothetical protein
MSTQSGSSREIATRQDSPHHGGTQASGSGKTFLQCFSDLHFTRVAVWLHIITCVCAYAPVGVQWSKSSHLMALRGPAVHTCPPWRRRSLGGASRSGKPLGYVFGVTVQHQQERHPDHFGSKLNTLVSVNYSLDPMCCLSLYSTMCLHQLFLSGIRMCVLKLLKLQALIHL